MANWCSNWVNIHGDFKRVNAFMSEIRQMEKESIENNVGVGFSDSIDARYMFEFYTDNESSFSFMTKWSPDFGNLRKLAEKHQVTVTNRYEELGNGVYGEWCSDGLDGSEVDVFLTDEEIDMVVEIDDDNSIWEFEGEQSDCREDLLSIILERKIN